MISIMFAEIERHLQDIPAKELHFGSGQYLFHLGDPVRAVHLVQEGMVHLARNQMDGSSVILQRAGPRSILAEASLYSDKYHCDATAISPTRTRAFTKVELQSLLKRSPEFGNIWASHLARELQRTRMQAEILALKTVAERLDAWIAWSDADFPRKGEWKTIANQIGVSPEALYREIANRRSPA
jgi:CRP/FNR family transcriptional regulator, dissimilatory nitrate respiration regulator